MNCSKTDYFHSLENGKIQCDLCPRFCHLSEGQRGLCFVRARKNDEIQLVEYGKSSGFCIDPIEKKPLNHFLPGSPVLSFGTAGCNLACKFCQNWDMSKSSDLNRIQQVATAEAIALKAKALGCQSVAFTYNDPVSFMEFAVDTAKACHQLDIHSVAVTAGYICERPREHLFEHMDAANVDLKAFTESFYKKICGGQLAPILETLQYLVNETDVWVEITNLLIPDENDSEAEIAQMTEWIVEHLGPEVPLHFSAFHPDWKMRDKPTTPLSTLLRARNQALDNGLKYVYTGNIQNDEGELTRCPKCQFELIQRHRYQIINYQLMGNHCPQCDEYIPGQFNQEAGQWGNAALIPIRMS